MSFSKKTKIEPDLRLFFNLPDGQVVFFEEFEQQKNCDILLVKKFLGLVEMTSGLVNGTFSLPEWQALKMIFFAPTVCKESPVP